MSDSLEKQLISAFSTSWNSASPSLLGDTSTLSLLALRDVSGEGVAGALAVAATWSSAFAAACNGAAGGVIICLFKNEDEVKIDGLIKGASDGAPKSSVRALINATLAGVKSQMASAPESASVDFGAVTYIDLTADESRLAAIVGGSVWVGTFSLSVGDKLDTQALLLYAPGGSLAALNAESASAASSEVNGTQTASVSAPSPRAVARRDGAPRNIERLLEVELDVVVRFGVTNVPLRDVVRMGVGTMVELDRSVDAPVELLINSRPFARGEVVVIDGYYGVRITEIGAPVERMLSLR